MATTRDIAEIQARMHGLLGQRAWGVALGQGSFLTMEFGQPVQPAKPGEVAHGEWHLWLYGCAWRLEEGEHILAASEDEPVKIERAIQRLEGRALQSFDLLLPALDAVITFEDGVILRLFSVETEEMDSWMLFTPDKVITVGPPAQHKMGYRPVTKNLFVVKQAALSKMTDVSLLSAEFHGDIVVFEPRIAVLLDMNTHAEFMGLYQSRPNEEEPDTALSSLPSLALRKARWVRADDFKQFNMASSKRAYIESEKQVYSRIIFTQPELHPGIVRLLEDAKNMAHMGVKVESAHRPDSQREEIRFHIVNEALSLTISYTPYLQQSSFLETWIDQWVRSFEQVDFSGETLPDHGCAISYTKSFLDYLSMFEE